MRIIYLDQNKWIDLAKAFANPKEFPEYHDVLVALNNAVRNRRLVVALSATNIFESQKINDPKRRELMGRIQSQLSGGVVLRCGSQRFKNEITAFLRRRVFDQTEVLPEGWFLSNDFVDAFADSDALQLPSEANVRIRSSIQKDPAFAAYRFITDLPENIRKEAVQKWTEQSRELIRQLHSRREVMRSERLSLHRRVYKARLLLEKLDPILAIARSLGLNWETLSDPGPKTAKRIINELPYFFIETELALVLERSDHVLNENDLRDMQAMSAALPYSDFVIIEKAFANYIVQADLGRRLRPRIFTDLRDVLKFL